MRKGRFLIIALMALTICMLVTGMVAAEDKLAKGEELVLKVRNMYYSENSNVAEMKSLLKAGKEAFTALPEGHDKNYWLAQVEFYTGLIAHSAKDKKEAERALEASKELLEKALKANPNSSVATGLLADVYTQLMNYKGFGFQMTNGTKLRSLPTKAIELDGKNYGAHISLAVFYLNSPGLAGGSVEKGIETLETALQSNDPCLDFQAYTWLAFAYNKNKNKDMALKNIKKALEIYPSNTWAKGILSEIQK